MNSFKSVSFLFFLFAANFILGTFGSESGVDKKHLPLFNDDFKKLREFKVGDMSLLESLKEI